MSSYGTLTRIPEDTGSVALGSTDGFSRVTSSLNPRTERPLPSRQVSSRGSLSSTGTRTSSSHGSRLQVTVTGRTEDVTDLLGRLNFDGPSEKGKDQPTESAATQGHGQTRLPQQSRYAACPPPITSSNSSYHSEVRAPIQIPPAAASAASGPYLIETRAPSSRTSSAHLRHSSSSTSSSRTNTAQAYTTRTVAPSRGMNVGSSSVARDALSRDLSARNDSRYASG